MSVSVKAPHGLTFIFLLINYLNNAAPTETKSIYQFNNSDKKDEINDVKQVKGKGQKSKGPQNGKGSKGSSGSFQPEKGKSKGKGKTKSKGKGQWTTWSWNLNQNQSWSQNQGGQKGQKGKRGKGKVYCQVCGKSDHQAHPCWWSNQQQQQQQGAQTQLIIAELKASLQYLGVSSGSTHSDSTTRSTSRSSRSTTSCSTSAIYSESCLHSLWVSVFCPVSPWPGRRIQWSQIQHQAFHSTHQFGSRGQRDLCFISVLNRSQSPSASSGAMGRTHSHLNCTCIVRTSRNSHSSHRSTCQCEW